MKFQPYAIICCCIYLLSCAKKETPIPVENLPVSQALLQNWGFKPGSYWIVTDSVRATIDSIYVTSYSSESHIVTRQAKKFNEEVVSVTFNRADLYAALKLSSMPDKIDGVLDSYGTEVTVLDLDTALLAIRPASGIYKNNMVTQFQAGGNTYPSVRAIYYTYELNPPSQQSIYLSNQVFWCTGVGIVKRIIYPEIRAQRNVFKY